MIALEINQLSSREAKRRATELLISLNFGHRLNNYPTALSGGEAQRVPMAPVGENSEHKLPASRQEMSIPVASPIVRRVLNNAPSAAITIQPPPLNTATAESVEVLAKARMSYKVRIAALINRNKEYPLFARKAGQQGTCSVRCTMICDGTIKRVELVKSSGSEALDKAGLRAVNNVGKFPPPPHDGGCTELSFEVPISFHLG